MKNFPHQFNQIDRIVAALRVFGLVADAGQNLADDTVVGRALAQGGVYQFRDKSVSLTENLTKEEAKPRQSRGTETCARDLRRLFGLLGMLSPDGAVLSARGLGVIAAGDTTSRNNILRQALQEMALTDGEGGSVSHPYQILLRLVEARPGLPGEFLGLCLEADDDSPEEFDRLLSIIDGEFVDAAEAYDSLGISDHMARNSIKVLPPLARQLGDILVDADGRHRLRAPLDEGTGNYGVQEYTRARTPRHPRSVTADRIATWQRSEVDPDDPPPPVEPEDVARAIRVRAERTDRHNQLVRQFAEALELAGMDLMEYPFDCLGLGDGFTVLCEMKSLDGTQEDERVRVCACVAQLLYYEAFDVPVAINKSTLKKVAVFESPISTVHQQFLESHDCIVTWRTPTGGFTGSANGLALLRSIGMI